MSKRSKNFLANAALGAGMALAFVSANGHTAHAAQKSNIDERIDRLEDTKSKNDSDELSALKAWKVNSESKNLTTLTSTKPVKAKVVKTVKAKPAVSSTASSTASSAASSAYSTARSQAQSSSASAHSANRQVIHRQTQPSRPAASSAARSTTSSASVAGLNMNQTSGTVSVTALANYMASRHPIMSAAAWRNVIFRESGGSLTATNPISGAYGVFQLLGHGEYRGMTLGAQIAMACALPASAWQLTNY